MEVRGYALIRKESTTGISPAPMGDFEGEIVRVFEFDKEGGILCINRKACAIATFDKIDILMSFECEVHGNVIIEPGLNQIDKLLYYSKAIARKGGYPKIIKSMVIASSLQKGKFHDSILWAKQ